jgi:pectate lyase
MRAVRTLFATACLVAIIGRWGVGVQPVPVTSGTFLVNNFFLTAEGVTLDQFISRFTNGSAIHIEGTLHNGLTTKHQVDPLAAYNAARDPDLLDNVGWTPTIFRPIDRTILVPVIVALRAGPFRW